MGWHKGNHDGDGLGIVALQFLAPFEFGVAEDVCNLLPGCFQHPDAEATTGHGTPVDRRGSCSWLPRDSVRPRSPALPLDTDLLHTQPSPPGSGDEAMPILRLRPQAGAGRRG